MEHIDQALAQGRSGRKVEVVAQGDDGSAAGPEQAGLLLVAHRGAGCPARSGPKLLHPARDAERPAIVPAIQFIANQEMHHTRPFLPGAHEAAGSALPGLVAVNVQGYCLGHWPAPARASSSDNTLLRCLSTTLNYSVVLQ